VGAPRPVTPVGILVELLGSVSDRLTDEGVRADLERALALAAGLDPYVARCTSPESPALAALAARTSAQDWSDRPGDVVFLEQEMLSGHVEGQALQLLIHATRARRVLEIGMFTGYSALAMAEALPDDGVVVACELDESVAEFARDSLAASPAGRKVEIRVGPALETLTSLAGSEFDLIFLDADKAGYVDYLDAILGTGLLGRHGVLCVDNTLLQGEPYATPEPSGNGRSVADFNQVLADDPRVAQVLLPLRDGLTLVRRLA
jgi:caffeoyl-CoA O-methyltransferase